MSFHYTSETHVQMLISLLKANGISKITSLKRAINKDILACPNAIKVV